VGCHDFWIKNASATYQRAMNLIFHVLLSIIDEVYIDDIVVKLAGLGSHLADLHLAFEKMCQYGLKMNPLKCAFGVSAGKFLGFVIHEQGIEIDPKRVESMKKVKVPTCKREFAKLPRQVKLFETVHIKLVGRSEGFYSYSSIKE
jgi:hypothetical protein